VYPEVPVEIIEPEPTVPLETFALPEDPRLAKNREG